VLKGRESGWGGSPVPRLRKAAPISETAAKRHTRMPVAFRASAIDRYTYRASPVPIAAVAVDGTASPSRCRFRSRAAAAIFDFADKVASVWHVNDFISAAKV
jgi:hypothetical protein